MKATKTFDCVALKNGIQAKLLKEREGMTDAEVRALVQRRLQSSDSSVARLWRKLTARQGEGADEA